MITDLLDTDDPIIALAHQLAPDGDWLILRPWSVYRAFAGLDPFTGKERWLEVAQHAAPLVQPLAAVTGGLTTPATWRGDAWYGGNVAFLVGPRRYRAPWAACVFVQGGVVLCGAALEPAREVVTPALACERGVVTCKADEDRQWAGL